MKSTRSEPFRRGLSGELKAEKGNAITVKDCKNYGKIEAMNDGNDRPRRDREDHCREGAKRQAP
ncbi:MAG: hypothetical protein ACLTT1_01765 [[Clostridium] scindens]